MSNEKSRANIYSLLDQRVVQHGKPLYLLIKSVSEQISASVTTTFELEEQVASLFGRWSPDADKLITNQSILALEHIRLLNDIAAEDGPDLAIQLENHLFSTVVRLMAKYKELGLVVWRGIVTPASEINTNNAYAALNQRTLLSGFLLHDEIKAWVQSKKADFEARTEPVTDMGYLTLARQFMGNGQDGANAQPNRFQKIFTEFMNDILVNTDQGRAVVIQSALSSTFARAIRRYVRELKLEANLIEEAVIASN